MPPSQATTVVKTGSGGFSKIFKIFFSHKMIVFFTLVLIINSFVMAYTTHSADSGLKDLAGRFLTPMLNLQQESKVIIERGSFFTEPVPIYKELWELLNFISYIWIVYILIYVIALIWGNSPFSNIYNTFQNVSVSVLIFLFIQMLYLANIEQSIWIPFIAFLDFFKAVLIFIKPLASFAEKFIGVNDQLPSP